MVTSVDRSSFTNSLAGQGGYVDTGELSTQLEAKLKALGIDKQELDQLAGPDRVIRGASDFERLFQRINQSDGRVDREITTHDSDGSITAAGQLYEALKSEVKENRARTAREGGQRFAGNATLDATTKGMLALELGDRGEHVTRVKQALIDVGYLAPSNLSSELDEETAAGVARFQREVGLPETGKVDGDTLFALAAESPPPGHKLERFAEYDRMFADGRLDVTIALGFDGRGATHDQTRDVLSGLRAKGYKPVDRSKLDSTQRGKLGLGDDRYDSNAKYFHKRIVDPASKKPVDTVVRLILASPEGPNSRQTRESFKRALAQDEVVIYGGQARYGAELQLAGQTPPAAGLRHVFDRDRADVRGVSGRPEYQLLIFDGNSTEQDLASLRDGKVFGRTGANTDVIATTTPTSPIASGQHIVRFLEGVTQRESNNALLADQNRIEETQRARHGQALLARGAANTYTESGFLGNSLNRAVAVGGAR